MNIDTDCAFQQRMMYWAMFRNSVTYIYIIRNSIFILFYFPFFEKDTSYIIQAYSQLDLRSAPSPRDINKFMVRLDGVSTAMWTQNQVAFLPALPTPTTTFTGCNSGYVEIRDRITCTRRRSYTISSLSSGFRGSTISFQHGTTRNNVNKRRRTSPTITSQLNMNDLEGFQRRAAALGANTRKFLASSTGQLFVWGGLFWLLISGQIGWILQSFLFLLFMFSVVPVLGILVLRFWLNRQLVQGECPSCGAAVTGLKGRSFQCMNCGQMIQNDEFGNFSVKDPATATIDIHAKRID